MVRFEEKWDYEVYDAVQGYLDCDCFVRSVLQQHEHVVGCLEVFQPYINKMNLIKKTLAVNQNFDLH